MSTLPSELLLEIFRYTPPSTLWSIRSSSKQFKICAEDTARTEVVPLISINLVFSLGSGSHHRWYDVRATMTFGYSHFDKQDPSRSTFRLENVRPDRCGPQAVEKWMHLRDEDAHNVDIWQVGFNDATRAMPLHQLQIENIDGSVEISFNWHAMLQRFAWEAG